MGSGSSRLETRWWEAEAQQKLMTTTNTGEVEVICSLIPGLDETTMIGHLKARSDLDTLFALHCRCQNLPTVQRADPSNLGESRHLRKTWHLRKKRHPKKVAP